MLSMSGLGSLTKVPQKGGAGHPCRGLQAVSLCCLHLHTFGAGSFKQSNCNARAHFVGAITVHDRPHPPLQLPPSRQQQTQTADSYFLFFFPPSPTTFTPRRAPFPTTSFLTTTVRHPPPPHGSSAMDHCAAVLLLFPESFSNDLPDPEYHKAARQHVQKVENLSKDGLLVKFAPQLLPVSPPPRPSLWLPARC